jgi:hypothetical protein
MPPRGTVEFQNLSIGGPQLISPLEDGAEIMRFGLGPRTDVDVYGDFAFDIAFEQTGVGKGQPVLPLMTQLIDATDQGIRQLSPLLA